MGQLEKDLKDRRNWKSLCRRRYLELQDFKRLDFKLCLINSGMLKDGGFFVTQGNLMPPYFVHGKKNQRRLAEKDLLLGRFVIFQTRPRIVSGPMYPGR